MRNNQKLAFSIIEVLIAIFIFALGITSIYMLINSSIKANNYNKNQIIAVNLVREELELIRNIRDSNYKSFNVWNKKNPEGVNSTNYLDSNVYFLTGHIYILENDFSPSADFPIKVNDITTIFWEWKSELEWKMNNYRLCLTSQWIYTYDCSSSSWNKKTKFYRYLKIDEVKNSSWVIQNALKVTSKVIWYINWYHEIKISTILTDWKRL